MDPQTIDIEQLKLVCGAIGFVLGLFTCLCIYGASCLVDKYFYTPKFNKPTDRLANDPEMVRIYSKMLDAAKENRERGLL